MIETLPIAAPAFRATDFLFKVATTKSEIDGFWRLRHEVFCKEQQIFDNSDRDAYDDIMVPIVCASLLLGIEDRVMGAVRIDEREPGIWWGSRLCVAHQARRISTRSPGIVFRNDIPPGWHSVGASLIYKAVTTAHARGCRTFLATVQAQNARFFERLHWTRLEDLIVCNRPHVLMQADLNFYPPIEI